MRDRHPSLSFAAQLAASVLFAWAALPSPGFAAEPAWRTSRVSYLAGRSAYVEAGQADGIAIGDTLFVVRDGTRIAALRAAFVSNHRASCDTLWTRTAIAVGDAVSYQADVAGLRAAVDSTAALAARGEVARRDAVVGSPTGTATRRDARMRGRLGARWLGVESDGAGRTSQPALELRLDARDGLGGHADVSLDVRGRRTMRTTDAGQSLEQYSRIYRAAVTLRDEGARRRLTFGRQSSPTLASVSVFDGALAEWSGSRHAIGGFAGTQPDPQRYRFSSEVFEAGGYAEVHQAPLAANRWSLAAGGVSSRHGGELDRDFAFAQGWWFARAMSASFAQELDLNHGWKRDAGEPALSWTSTFATVRVPVNTRVALMSGYDNRRNVRLWRDQETPETEFDDRYRQGAWAGGSVDWNEFLATGAEFRGGTGPDESQTWSVNAELHRATRWHVLMRGRWSRYASPVTASALWTGGVGFDPDARSHVELSGGLRSTRDLVAGFEDSESWYGVDMDVALGQRWYASGSFEWLTGLAGSSRQVQAGLSVRL